MTPAQYFSRAGGNFVKKNSSGSDSVSGESPQRVLGQHTGPGCVDGHSGAWGDIRVEKTVGIPGPHFSGHCEISTEKFSAFLRSLETGIHSNTLVVF